MWTLCFPLLMSLALAAPGVSRNCYNFCNSQKLELMKGDPPLECNCADLIATSIEANQLSTVTLDDTGVYFVPAELQLFQEQFASQPFVILNPAKLVPKFEISRINREFDNKKDSLDDFMPSQSEHVEIHERTETISHTSINQKWGRQTPLYLDLELEDTNGNERAAVYKSTLVEDFESTEEALVECLDYQVIHFTRKYGFIKEFKEFWEARNLNRYEQVPNKEIEEKIKDYCSKPEAIVQQSLHEIKQGLPKKRPDSESNVKNKIEHSEVNIDETLLADITDYRNFTSLITSSALSDNATGPDHTEQYNTSTENYNVSENATKLYDTTFDPTENWPFMTFINSSHSSTLDTETKNEIAENSTPSVVTDFAQTVTTTENTSIVDIQEKPTIPASRKKTVTERESELDSDMASMASEDVFHTYRTIKLTQDQTTGRPILDKITNSLPISNTPSSTEETLGKVTATEEVSTEESLAKEYATTEGGIEESFRKDYATTQISTEESLGKQYATAKVSTEESFAKEYATAKVSTEQFFRIEDVTSKVSTEEPLGKKNATIKGSNKESLGKEYATTEVIPSDMQSSSSNNNETTQIVVNSGYAHIRNTYDEKEIKIPKIITKECQNTVYSGISGTEDLPNDDFIDSTTAESGSSETRTHNGNNRNSITGKLYFVSKTELVPVRFVQSNTGAISLGIDGIALCDKLVRKTNKKSRLLASLCDYMEID